MVDRAATLRERIVTSETTTRDSFVALDLLDGAADLSTIEPQRADLPFCDEEVTRAIEYNAKPLETLEFIPYYFRANRGGRGHMRVGLRPWDRT